MAGVRSTQASGNKKIHDTLTRRTNKLLVRARHYTPSAVGSKVKSYPPGKVIGDGILEGRHPGVRGVFDMAK